ncbi:MAG: hypothetical protein JSU98_05605 [Gemmatimonadales bacterium]|nr:MAG: hypothetical protein JSU98_05605 [Gemmatimonadales bacterium]
MHRTPSFRHPAAKVTPRPRAARTPLILAFALLTLALPLSAQQNPRVAEAQRAFDELDYGSAAVLAEAALQENLSTEDRVAAYEVLGYTYGILDDADRAVAMLSQMILLDPEREPDVQALPPRLVGLYNQALGQVLVVRGLLVDSASFVSGEGRVTLHYEVSRPATAELRVVGNGVDQVIQSALTNPGPARFDWGAQLEGDPLPPGDYQLLVTAREGRSEYQGLIGFGVDHSAVDTLPLLTRLEGFDRLPETERPPRDWRPLGITTLLTGAVGGAALALNNSAFDGARLELGLSALVGLGTALALSLRRPDPRPVPAAIRYNELVDRTLQDRNAEIAQQNVERRRRVRLTIQQETGS